ncbi:hypothetical protein HYH02_009265 [Chlamydomonas schloesseri]|uniref:Thioredoxin domain-containing protein n=1 Tax=Chlamydomonas schloesseri TaxID=2026947 RepID=A0A835W9H3_9CHLO|nr:hypothetical protein HYH02_009265 [Chlamydomonas schloesseri]|eukprot:KAG2443188.1 hypothetical protein HYH02_009265 [Chlamydomonas schloesseri]
MHPCAGSASKRAASARHATVLPPCQHHARAVACRATPEGPVGTSEPPKAAEAPGASSSGAPPAGAQPAPQREAPRGGDGVQRWLGGRVDLPAGYRTTRRELLKLVTLAGGAGCLWVAGTRLEAMKYGSPAALMNALAPPPDPSALAAEGDRVAAFKRYIADLERRGGGKEVPDFPRGADWINSAPLTLAGAPPSARGSLAGRVTVLDFWTYCCINCIHVLPDLAQLEAQFAGAPVCVVGVHSAKFDNEKDSSAIRAAVLRYDISHPVVNDRGMAVWAALGVSSWPTLAVVSPRGRLIAMLSGEGHRQDLEDLINAALQYYGEKGELDGSTPLPLELERNKQQTGAASPLRYPGKLATDLAGGRLFVADSNNHRVVVTDLSGKFIEAVGGNGPALRDGSFEAAALNRPQGLAFSPRRNTLYVADTENHAVRAIDLTAKTVVTLAGNGTKGRDYRGGKGGSAQALNSPWDVALDAKEEYLYIALAGQHQIWDLELSSGLAGLFSGSGSERNQNGPTPFTTSWAQPSGLSLAGDGSGLMYVADSESSTVRVLDLSSGGSGLKVGGDPLFSDNLFRFGDKDGFGPEALLQHPLAVLSSEDGGVVYVADSYNHRIKVLNPNTNEITTLAGSGQAGFRDGAGTAAAFSEPAGLARGPGGTVLVADTNNGAIRVLDPASGRRRRVTTLALTGVPPPRVDPLTAISSGAAAPAAVPAGFQLVRAQQPLAVPLAAAAAAGSTAGGAGAGTPVTVTIGLPAGYHLTAGAGSNYYTQVLPGAPGADVTAVSVRPASGPLPDTSAPSVTLTVSASAAAAAAAAMSGAPQQQQQKLLLRVLAKVYYCQQNDVCLFEQICFEIPLALGGADGTGAAGSSSSSSASLRYEVVPAAPSSAFVFQ